MQEVFLHTYMWRRVPAHVHVQDLFLHMYVCRKWCKFLLMCMCTKYYSSTFQYSMLFPLNTLYVSNGHCAFVVHVQLIFLSTDMYDVISIAYDVFSIAKTFYLNVGNSA